MKFFDIYKKPVDFFPHRLQAKKEPIIGAREERAEASRRQATRCASTTWRPNLAPATRTKSAARGHCASVLTALLCCCVEEVRGLRLSKDQLRETYFDGTILNFRPGPVHCH